MATPARGAPRHAAPPPPDDSIPWLSAGTGALIYAALSFVYFLPALLPGRQVFGTDYLAGGYMFYEFIGERLASGDLPKWVPYVYGGMPLAANPGSTYHPVHLLADLLLPTSKVLTVVFIVHFFLAGIGMYLLGRELGCRRWVAFVGGLCFQFTGLTMSWVYAGHDGRIMVATVAPLFFFFLHRGIRTGRIAAFAGAAGTLGLALLSFQIQNAYYLLLSAAIWSLFALVHLGVVRDPRRLARTVALGLGAVAVGFLMASVDFLPFVDYVPQSPRGTEGRGYEFATSYSMPEGEIVALAVPEHHGVSVQNPETGQPLFPAYHGENRFKLHTEYVGALVILLLAVGALVMRKSRYWWFFLGLTLFVLTVALGGNTPIYRLYYALLPGTKQFRAPSLIFFIASLSLNAMAMLTLERLAALRDALDRETLGRLVWPLVGVVAAAFLGAAVAGAEAAQGWTRFALFAALLGGVLWSWSARKLASGAAFILLALLALTDLWIIDRRFFHTAASPEEIFAADDVTTFLQSQPGEFRVWTFPYPQAWRSGGPNGSNFPMLFDIDQAGGEHPNPLQRWIDYIGAGEQTFTDWHNLASDLAVVETPEGQAIAFRAAPGFLEAANLRYVISMAPLRHPALREVHRGSALVYENAAALPRAYLVPTARETAPDGMLQAMLAAPWDPRTLAFVEPGGGLDAGAGAPGTAAIAEYTPDRIVVRTRSEGEALLVIADNYYEGWRATAGGRELPVLRVNHTFRGVRVPRGETEVVMEYRPTDLYTGFAVSFGTMALLLLGAGGAAWRERRRGARPAAA